MIFDPLYLIMIAPVFLFSLWASWRVKANFNEFSRYASRSGMTGADVARRILQAQGISGVPVERTEGSLTDHYSPGERVLRLSEDVYGSTSIAAIGVAAHEAGHAIQHHTGYSVMGLWQALAKPAMIGSNVAYWLILAGMFFSAMRGLALVGLILFGAVVAFQIVTLPLEFNASNRAKRLITEYGILDHAESHGVSKVLNAAAMTYIAAAASSVVTLLYYLIRLGLLGGSDD